MSGTLRIATVVLGICLFAQTSIGSGGFLDGWISSKTTGNANYLNGQKRGTLFGGSFSAHWPVSENNNLVTVTPPKTSGGCGGIDFYGGNIAFLKPEMLVKKWQHIMQNSAGIAYQIALDTISSKLNTITNAAESLSNALNKMSMDDCNAAKGLVTSVRSGAEDIAQGFQMGEIGTGVQEAFTDSYATLKQSIPAVKTLSDTSSWFNSQTGKPASNIPSMSGCTDPLMAAMFPYDSTAYPTSALKVIGTQIGLPSQYQDMLRAMIGDLKVVWNGAPNIWTIFPCPNNRTTSLDFLSAGNYKVKDINEACNPQNDANGNLQQYMSTSLTNIMTAMKSQSGLQAADTAFLQSMPLPVLYGIRMAILSGTDSSMVPTLANLAASEWMAAMMNDVITRYGQIFAALNDINNNQTDNTGSGAAGTICNLAATSATTKNSIKELMANADQLGRTINAGLEKQIRDFEVTQNVGQRLDELNKKLEANLQHSFGPAVTYRMMQKIKQHSRG